MIVPFSLQFAPRAWMPKNMRRQRVRADCWAVISCKRPWWKLNSITREVFFSFVLKWNFLCSFLIDSNRSIRRRRVDWAESPETTELLQSEISSDFSNRFLAHGKFTLFSLPTLSKSQSRRDFSTLWEKLMEIWIYSQLLCWQFHIAFSHRTIYTLIFFIRSWKF